MKKLLVILAMIVGCKTSVRKSEPSEPNFVKSNDGTMLMLLLGIGHAKYENYCVMKINENDPEKKQLLTTRGGLSKKQLGEALRFMGFLENTVLPAITSITAWFSLHSKWLHGQRESDKLAKLGDSAKADKAMLKAGIVGIAIFGTYHAGKIAYRVVKAKEEGQGTREQIESGMYSGLILGPIVEFNRRGERVKKAISNFDVLRFSNKKMAEVVIKISDMEGKFPESCNHLKPSMTKK